jgi:hypothetical protein
MFHLCYWHFQSTTQLDLIHRHMQISISNTVYDSVLILWTWRSVHDLTRSYPIPYVVRTDLTKLVTVPRPFLSVNSVPLILSDTFWFGSVNNHCAWFYKGSSLLRFSACFLFMSIGFKFWSFRGDGIHWKFLGQTAASGCGFSTFRQPTPSPSSGCSDGLVAVSVLPNTQENFIDPVCLFIIHLTTLWPRIAQSL